MIKSSDIIGKPMRRKETDKPAETIYNIILDPETNRILGFVLDENTPLSETRIVLWEGVEKINHQGVILLSEKYLIPAGYAPPIQEIMAQDSILHRARAITSEGEEVGQLVDVYFNETTGEIEGFDVTGPETQLANGPIFVPMSIIMAVKRNVVVINGAVADVLDWVKA